MDRSEVHVSFELEPQFKIYSNEYAKINRTLLGDASIEFVDDPNYVGEVFEIGADDLIPGQYRRLDGNRQQYRRGSCPSVAEYQ